METFTNAITAMMQDTPSAPSVSDIRFEDMHRTIYVMCLNPKYEEVSVLLDETIERVYEHDHREWILPRVHDFFMYYNNTCHAKGLQNFSTKLASFRAKRDHFSTPPPSP